MYVYIYIYIFFFERHEHTANLPTNIVDLRGVESSIILIIRGGIPWPIGDFPESLSQAILVGVMLVGRLGVLDVVKRDMTNTMPCTKLHMSSGRL